MRTSPARLLLAVAQKLFREALITIINQARGFQVFADSGTGAEAIDICRREAPDLVVIAVELEGMAGIEATREILRLRPGTKIILLVSSTEESTILRAIRSGAVGIVCTSSPISNLVEALRAVQQGRCYLGPTAWNAVVHRVREVRPQSRSGLEHLSPQDRKLIGFIIQGKTTKQIAATLGVAEGTLRSRREELMRKMGVKNIAELITSALGRGFEQ
ncbi:MAG: two component transcriptional regulator, LuxR family [Bryobacterales bacterium]|nr:two component transcriptional regulator, LuxR family [Bryobacterales bacterium]